MGVCVFFRFLQDIKFVGRTSRGHTGFFIHRPSAVRALIFSREGFSLSEGTLVIGLILRSLWGLYKIHETLWFYLVSL